jgi:hypothetical protein
VAEATEEGVIDMSQRLDQEAIERIEKDIDQCRAGQVEKWGKREYHSKQDWAMILGKRQGKFSQAAWDAHYDGSPGNHEDYRRRLVQLAACAFAAIEQFDREW